MPPQRCPALLASLVLAVVVMLSGPTLRAEEPPQPEAETPAMREPLRVLVISENPLLAPWYDISLDSFRETMRRTYGYAVTMQRDYVNMERYADPAQRPALLAEFAANHAGPPPDLILTLENGLTFALEQRDVLFPEVPVVATSVEAFQLGDRTLPPGVTAVLQTPSPDETIEAALRLLPKLKHLYVVAGEGPLPAKLADQARRRLEPLAGKLDIQWFTGMRYEEVRQRLSELPPDSAVLFVLLHRDITGRRFVSQLAAEDLAQAANAPMFVIWGTFVGGGELGGVVVDPAVEGRETADQAALLLDGGLPPPRELPHVPVWDWRALQRFGISTDKLPAGSIVRYEAPSLWETHRGEIVIAAAALVILALTSFILAVENGRRKRAQRRLVQAQTELRRSHDLLEDRVQERTRELAEANTELEAFNYSVSHDLRSPLQTIIGFSEMLAERQAEREGEGLDETSGHLLERIQANGRHMDRLIEDMLRLSRFSRAEMRREEVDLSTLAHEVLEGLREREGEREREVRVEIAPNLHAVGDARWLRVLLENLLGNALKFTRDAPDAAIGFERAAGAGSAGFVVWDNGIGFDPAQAERMFAPFARLHTQSDYEGSGIGLALVQRIVARHGGTIRAEGQPGQGARFVFTLGS